MNYSTDFKSIRDQVSPEEWQTRLDLAACYRLVDKYEMTDLIYNHITARIPGPEEHLLINLYGLLYKEITASSLVKIDLEGNIVWKPPTDYGINKSGYVIHGAIHKARPDVKCVLHTHTRAGMAVAAMACGLLPMSQTSMRFAGHIGYHDYEGPAIDLEGNTILQPDHDYSVNAGGYVTHSAVHSARHDAECVIHTHTRAGMAVAAMACGLLPLSQTAIRFVDHLGYHDYEGPAVDLDERARLVRDLGPHDAMIMRNHGLLTCGATIQQALNTMYQLELSCRSQVDAMAARTELAMPGENVLKHTAHLYQPGTRRPYGVLEWPAMLRLLDADEKNSGYPSYKH